MKDKSDHTPSLATVCHNESSNFSLAYAQFAKLTLVLTKTHSQRYHWKNKNRVIRIATSWLPRPPDKIYLSSDTIIIFLQNSLH